MPVNIIDLTSRYIELMVKQDRPDEYRKLYPALFEHYLTYWGDREYPFARLDPDDVAHRTARLRRRLAALQELFTGFGAPLNDLPIVLFVGQGSTNGHAFLENGNPVVWLPVETYGTDLSVDVFATHEIFHAVHYERSPEFYFHDHEERHRVSRLLITEGLVTYLSQKLLGIDDLTALWADLIGNRKAAQWLAACRRKDNEIRRMLTEHFDRSEPDWGPFVSRDEADIFNYRCGYYTGLRITQEIAALRAGDPAGLLSVDRRSFERLFREHLDPARFGERTRK